MVSNDKSQTWILLTDSYIGKSIERTKIRQTITPFEGERAISKLDTFPTQIMVGDIIRQIDPELEAQLVARGEKYWRFAHTVMQRGSVEVNYDGVLGGSSSVSML